MTNKNSNSGPEPEQADPLSATAMFLNAFEGGGESAPKAPDPFAPGPPSPRTSPVAERPPAAVPSRPFAGPGGGAPGEFTQMFNSQGQRPAAPPAQPREAAPQDRGPHEQVSPRGLEVTQTLRSPQAPGDSGAGEFTRIFVPGGTPPYTPPSRPPEDTPRPGTLFAGPSKSKGFSSPGASDSASAEGGISQFFNTIPRQPASAPPAPPRPAPPPPAADTSWKNDPFFRPPEKSAAPEGPSPSVTNILSSLAGPGSSAPRRDEPAPYRADPLPSYAPPKPSEDAGGVTQFIQRLSQEQLAPPVVPAPAPAPVPPPSQGPGEYTRMIEGLGAMPAAAAPAPAPPPPAPKAAPAFAVPAVPLPAAPAFAAPAVPAPPPLPRVAPPPIPAAPAPHAAGAPAAPSFGAPAIPAMPKPALPPVPMPAVAPPKSKLEAMVPILLVINTFLLVLLLVVVIFLIKAK